MAFKKGNQLAKGRKPRVPPKSCKACGEKFQPTNNRSYECYNCVPEEHRKFNNKLRRYGKDFGYLKYIEMLKDQDYKCKICRKEVIPKTTSNNSDSAVVDHCHSTGKIRGILCRRCNLGIGYFDDDKKNLESAILFLKESEEENVEQSNDDEGDGERMGEGTQASTREAASVE